MTYDDDLAPSDGLDDGDESASEEFELDDDLDPEDDDDMDWDQIDGGSAFPG